MSIATTAPHGHTLEALSRVAVLLVEHRDQIPPVYISVAADGSVGLQVTAAATFSEDQRKAAVEFIARTLHLDPPHLADTTNHYRAANGQWSVFTPVSSAKCPTCQKPVVR